MERQIRVRITKDGKVEIDSSIFKDCKEVAEHLTRHLGKIETFVEKDETADAPVKVKIETGE
ncbi:MAG: hypothetical protein HY887_03610 [Deltaproteobacteria bacterium]|nr:hypothetical protein [Deltaproteobacteria bacterium]